MDNMVSAGGDSVRTFAGQAVRVNHSVGHWYSAFQPYVVLLSFEFGRRIINIAILGQKDNQGTRGE